MTSKSCLIDVDATSSRRIDVSKALFKRHVPAGIDASEKTLYFIFSSEIMQNISAINVVSIYSEMIWYHFTVD